MFAVQLTGVVTGFVFVLYARYSDRPAAQRAVDRMRSNNPSPYVRREIIAAA